MALRTLATYAAITFVTVVGAEIVLRAWSWSPTEAVTGDSLGSARYDHSQRGAGDLVPGQDGHWVIWFHRPYHVQTNSLGLRHTEEPSETAFRVLAIGDSQTFGPYLPNEDTWPGWTENQLRLMHRSRERVQVFNAGVSGYSIRDELAYMRDKGVAFRPKLVVLAVFENDLPDLRKPHGQRPQPRPNDGRGETWKWLTRNSALVHVAADVRTMIQRRAAGVDIRRGEGEVKGGAKPADDRPALAAAYGEHFHELAALLRQNDIRLATVFIPAHSHLEAEGAEPSDMEPLLRRLSEETHTPYLDLTPVFRARPQAPARLYLLQREANGSYGGNGHLSREGQAETGTAVARWLAEQNLVPR
jgi:lysophospholipase L1-like esterase